MMPARRHKRAKKNTVSMLPSAAFHQIQLPAIPFRPTKPATASGVSAAKVVATIEVPASHHGRLRPLRKKSVTLLPPRDEYHRPIAAEAAKYAPMMIQSRIDSVMTAPGCLRWRRRETRASPAECDRCCALDARGW